MRILVIEDDAVTAAMVQQGLEAEGHAVTAIAAGREGLVQALTSTFEAIVLDRLLPDLDGLALLNSLRSAGTDTPVIMLSAVTALDERMACLAAGADDYITKPFSLNELAVRLKVVTRRVMPVAPSAERVLAHGSLRFDRITQVVTRFDQVIELTRVEKRMIEQLLLLPGELVSYRTLAEVIWGQASDSQLNVIRVHMAHLRAKVERDEWPRLIHTVRGQGFMLDERA